MNKFQLDLISRIEKGIKYCDTLWNCGQKCVRLIKKYDCETCDEKLLFCKCWRKIIELHKLYYISQIIDLINRYDFEQIQLPEWAKYQKKAERMDQMNLFKRK